MKNVKDEDSCDDLVSHPAFITIAIDTHENIGEICVRSSSGDINIPIIFLGIFVHTKTPILVANGTGKNRIELSSLETAAKVAGVHTIVVHTARQVNHF